MIKAGKRAPLTKHALYTVSGIAFLIFAVFAVMAFSMPLTITNTTTENNIEQACDMGYRIEVMPCALYPSGGVIEPEGMLMRNIIKSMLFDVNAYVDAEHAVQINGDVSLGATLVADGYW